MLNKISTESWRWFVGIMITLLGSMLVYTWRASDTLATQNMRITRLESDMAELKDGQKILQQILVTLRGIETRVEYLASDLSDVKSDLKEVRKN